MTRAAVVSAIGGVLVTAWLVWPTEADRVRQRVEDLAVAASVPAHESEVGRIARLAQLTAGLTPDVHVDLGDGGRVQRREVVVGLAGRALADLAPLDVELGRLDVTVDPDGTHATVLGVVGLRSARRAEQGLEPAVEDVVLSLVRHDGAWRLEGVARRTDAPSGVE
ncbi:MAG: hypothetical protein AB7G23_02185 [Vicinamibacterales bacterium]